MFDPVHVFEPLLDSKQALAPVQVHLKTLQRYAHAGIIAGLRMGKLWRFRASDLDHYLPHAISSEQLSMPPHHS
jgi:excisionase family DNA binding protein